MARHQVRADRGRAHRLILAMEGWGGSNDPEKFEKQLEADEARIADLIEEVRRDERGRLRRRLAELADGLGS